MNTAEFITITAAIVPDRVGFVDPDERVTFEQFQTRVNKLAQGLLAMGVGKGQNVGVMSVNSVKFVEAFYASSAVGATFVPLNFRAKPEELTYMINTADITTLFISERYYPLLQEIRATVPNVTNVITLGFEAAGVPTYESVVANSEDIPVFTDIDEDDVALLIFTSGTTAMPKGVQLSFRALTALVVNTQSPPDPVSDQEVVLASVPFFHIAGASTMASAVFSGRRLVILPAFDPAAWLQAVEDEGVTHAFVVPTMLKRTMEVDNFSSYNLKSLRAITYGAAPMPYEVVRRAVDVFPAVDLMNAYGQTEATGSMTYLGPDDHKMNGTPEQNEKKLERLRSVGRPMPDIEIGILSPEGRQLPQGEDGEICVRGDRVMRGYHKQEEATSSAIHDGWLHTGDVGRLDEDGYLFITGRIKDMIIRGGENIAPAEIEQVLEGHPAIAEAAVIGVPDLDWGEVVKALMIPVKGQSASEEDLTAFVKTKLASYKAPAIYEWVDDFPRNHLGKVLKNELRDQHAAKTANPA
ncbi:MAG: long-chain-fatty-acid--CoA ligase [Dehalococcoidia bacterium]